jgi:pyruvate, water dikinase
MHFGKLPRMDTQDSRLSTGLPGLDEVLKGLIPGDNIVWQVESIEDYHALVTPYCKAAKEAGRKLIYFRFASHHQLLNKDSGAEIHQLSPEAGFENFILEIHRVIEHAGRGAFYVFDCLSELAGDWYSDQMLGNFFMLTCPFLYDLETITYFALFKNHHSSHATDPIAETTQLLIDVIKHNGRLYIRPIKVQHRYSPTMHMLHEWSGSDFKAVTSSAVISEIQTSSEWAGLGTDSIVDFSARAILDAREIIAAMKAGRGQIEKMVAIFSQLSRMIISREQKILRLTSKYLTLDDVLDVAKRMIGTGLIGGKTVGMLLAREILKKADKRFADTLEAQDSFYVGSDVFYTFLVRNGVWWVRQKQRDPETFLEGAEQARRRILTGKFPDYILKQFEQMLDYFGQSPFIVRSSSLLEDNFGNSFAGKYESVFCANQGPRERRLEDFLAAVRSIYASTMSERALHYRANRGLLDQDEQMALLVMRVSGSMHGRFFYPAVAGVGFSYNPYAWSPTIDPKSGVLRLVFGLGTRAVNRTDDDYTRIIALNEPKRRPEGNFDEVRQYSQRRVDYLDLEANQLVSGYFADVTKNLDDLPIELFASEDSAVYGEFAHKTKSWILTFDRLLGDTDFVKDMREMLSILQEAYDYPVDIEFTANFDENQNYKINLVQCRPLQAKGGQAVKLPKIKVSSKDRIIEARSAVIGQSRLTAVDRFIYVVPSVYGQLPLSKRYEVARLVSDINRASDKQTTIMLLGPGRWGTSSPELGVPVAFSDINHVSILCEIVTMREDFVPDVSLGTHFLNELVEMDMLYLALFPKKEESYINTTFFEQSPSKLLDIIPAAEKWKDTVKVLDTADLIKPPTSIRLVADSLNQKVICYFAR